MVLAVAYALNAHQEVHRAPYQNKLSSTSACASSADSATCSSSATGAAKRCGGYGRDVREIVAEKEKCHAESAPVFPYLTHPSHSDVSAMYATPTQKRLAEIAEMIHTASLFHDDVIDKVRLMFLVFCFIFRSLQQKRTEVWGPICFIRYYTYILHLIRTLMRSVLFNL